MEIRDLEGVLGKQYTDNIESEINKLKFSERQVIGDIMCIVKKVELIPNKEGNTDESIYVVFKPTLYSLLSQKNLKTTSSANSNIKLISFVNFADQMFEFDFSIISMFCDCSEFLYRTDEFIKFQRDFFYNVENSDEVAKSMCLKFITIEHSILKDILSKKFKETRQVISRLAIVYHLKELIQEYFLSKTNSIDLPLSLSYNLWSVKYEIDRIKDNNLDSLYNEAGYLMKILEDNTNKLLNGKEFKELRKECTMININNQVNIMYGMFGIFDINKEA